SGIALALAIWGQDPAGTRTIHIQIQTDNTTALTWTDSLSSTNTYTRELNRCLARHLALNRLHVSATHIPGHLNVLADAGSRLSSPHHTALDGVNQRMVVNSGASHPALPVPPASALQLAVLAPSSKQRYITIWNEWRRYATSKNFHPILDARCEIHSARLLQFAKHLWHPATSNSISTIRGKLSIVSWFHQCHSNYAVGLTRSHSIEFAGLARQRHDNLAKAPASIAILRPLRSSLDLSITHDRVLWASTVLAYFVLLRRSEFLATNVAYSQHSIRQRDILFLDHNERQTTNLSDGRCSPIVHTILKDGPSGSRKAPGPNPLSFAMALSRAGG
ncbi:unnamed protein product, partial [Aphanomyces euteiches]